MVVVVSERDWARSSGIRPGVTPAGIATGTADTRPGWGPVCTMEGGAVCTVGKGVGAGGGDGALAGTAAGGLGVGVGVGAAAGAGGRGRVPSDCAGTPVGADPIRETGGPRTGLFATLLAVLAPAAFLLDCRTIRMNLINFVAVMIIRESRD